MNAVRFELRNLEVQYAKNVALHVDSLDIEDGSLHVLVGPNGSGKSTLLNTLAFLQAPSRGTLSFDGRFVDWSNRSLRTLRRRVTLLHQNAYLFSGTVASNVAFGPKMRGACVRDVKLRVQQSLSLVGLEGHEARNARHLSGGEARRVALARALACEPEVLLLDEPLAHLDHLSCCIVTRLMKELAASGITIVVSTHDSHLAAELDGRTIRLLEGTIEGARSGYGVPLKEAFGQGRLVHAGV